MPDNSETISIKQSNLPLPLPQRAAIAHIVSALKRNLVAIPQVVNAGYYALFTDKHVLIINKNTRKIDYK